MLETKVGVVAIGRNEGERLRRCLSSVPPALQLVYVDSASTDDSVILAKQRGAEVVELDMLRPFTAARARNQGLSRLHQVWPDLVYVQFVDGDCEFEDGWIEKAEAFLDAHSDAAVACGRRRERFRERSFYNSWMDEEWATPVGRTAACGGDALMRISAVLQLGGYDDELIAGEEPEFCSRLRDQGWGIYRLDEPMTIHDADMYQFKQWWRRAVRSGYGYAQVFVKTKNRAAGRLYGRELIRAFAWTFGVSAGAIFLAVTMDSPFLLVAPAIWLLQLVRLSATHGLRKGWHLLLGKAAEAFGAVRYAAAIVSNAEKRAIFYK